MKIEANSSKIFFTMNEVAEMFDITQTQLRNWEKRFSMLKPHRNRKGNRLFTADDIETLKIIHNLVVVKGIKIDGAAKEMQYNLSSLQRTSLAIDKLTAVRSMLHQVSDILSEATNSDDNENVLYTSHLFEGEEHQ